MAFLTGADQQGFVTSNAVQDTETFLQRKRLTFQPLFTKTYVQAYGPGLSDDDYSILHGEPLFKRNKTPLTVRSQYPAVFSSFTAYAVLASDVHAERPDVAGKSPDSVDLKNAARDVIAKQVRFMGLAAKDSVFRPGQSALGSDAPTIMHAGITDVWNFGETTIEAGDLVAWTLPRVQGHRTGNVQGFSRQKAIAEFERFDPRRVNPTVKDIAAQVTTKTPDQYDDFTKALADFVTLICTVSKSAAVQGINDEKTAQNVVRAVLGGQLPQELPAADPTQTAHKKILPELLASLQEHVTTQHSRIVGTAMSKADYGQQFTIYMKQVAF